jgi:DNA-binding transcriptional LysR family regulator
MLLENKIDFAFGQDIEDKDYTEIIKNEPYVLITSKENHLANCSEVDIETLSQQCLILPSSNCDIKIFLERYLSHQSLQFNHIIEVDQNEAILALVKLNIGVTILPKMNAVDIDKKLKYIPIKNNNFTRNITLLCNSNDLKKKIIFWLKQAELN